MIAVTLANPRHLNKANASAADYIEVRTDLYPNANFKSLLDRTAKPVIFTIKGKDSSLLDFLDHPRVEYVDIDYRLHQLIRFYHKEYRNEVKLIISFHDYKETPAWPDMLRQVNQLKQLQPDIIKVATMINHFDDNHVIMKLQKKLKQNGIAIGMGELGMITRVYNKAWLTYARLTKSETSIPGQITIDLMSKINIFGLVGDSIAYSLSPLMYNTSFTHHGLPHQYQLWDTSNWKVFTDIFKFFELPGVSITQPYKKRALQMVDETDEASKKIGAVNLIKRDKKTNAIYGYNTDWLGAKKALKGYIRGRKLMILGRGGAAAAVEYAAKQGGAASVVALSRKEMPTDEDDFDVLVNATPVYDMLLVPEEALFSKVVMDCNYGTYTELLRHAERLAVVAKDGIDMLIYQGEPHYKQWSGRKMPIEVVRKAINKHHKKTLKFD